MLECGQAMLKNGYKVKILNTINFKKSMHYNPFSYVHSEKDILKLVTTLMTNTKGEGSGGDPFWEKSERLLLTALIAYLHYEAPVEEQNFATLLEMLNTMQVLEDDEEYQNPVDLLFEDLGKKKPNSFAVRQYKFYKLAAGKTAKSILISCGARLAPFDIQELRDLTMYDELQLDTLGDKKTVLFLIMSDTDSTFNFLISMVYTQLFNLLCDKADDVYGGKLPIIRMSDVELTPVEWLWKPYLPFGKLSVLQGNPGEGKTYFAMHLAAACTNGKLLPNMERMEPFNVIYQTAEDGLGDTVKPRLIEAGADLDRVLVIDDSDVQLTLSDERIEKAIIENNARLVIIDPIQAYLGADVDMNRANEVRPIFMRLGQVAQRTGCAILLIGHLNKAAGMQSLQRGLGSIDIAAAVRSVLFIGKLKHDPTMRILTHEKSSLAPPGASLAFSLGDEGGFRWVGEYDITADEMLSGIEPQRETKTQQAKDLICTLLAGGKQVLSEDIDKAALERGIPGRTVRDAKRELGDALKSKIVEGRKKVFWME